MIVRHGPGLWPGGLRAASLAGEGVVLAVGGGPQPNPRTRRPVVLGGHPRDAPPRPTAGYLYQAVLRRQLTRTLGVEWAPVRRGQAEITGIPTDVLRLFSTRRGPDPRPARHHRSQRGPGRASRVPDHQPTQDPTSPLARSLVHPAGFVSRGPPGLAPPGVIPTNSSTMGLGLIAGQPTTSTRPGRQLLTR